MTMRQIHPNKMSSILIRIFGVEFCIKCVLFNYYYLEFAVPIWKMGSDMYVGLILCISAFPSRSCIRYYRPFIERKLRAEELSISFPNLEGRPHAGSGAQVFV